jgi:hypothetical protein
MMNSWSSDVAKERRKEDLKKEYTLDKARIWQRREEYGLFAYLIRTRSMVNWTFRMVIFSFMVVISHLLVKLNVCPFFYFILLIRLFSSTLPFSSYPTPLILPE